LKSDNKIFCFGRFLFCCFDFFSDFLIELV
jgi:hypothetical protein